MTSNYKLKRAWQKFWYLLWKDNTWKGWIFSIIVLFIFIKFIFFPVLSLLTGTSLPLAIVESCSMYHKDNLLSDFDEWYLKHQDKYSEFDINKKEFTGFIFKKGLNKGDILFVIGANPDKLKIGNAIIFEANRKNPLIHRIISIKTDTNTSEKIFSTIGDNNNGQLSVEKTITEEMLIGKPIAKPAPYLGWAKLFWFELVKEFDKDPNTNFEGFCKEN